MVFGRINGGSLKQRFQAAFLSGFGYWVLSGFGRRLLCFRLLYGFGCAEAVLSDGLFGFL